MGSYGVITQLLFQQFLFSPPYFTHFIFQCQSRVYKIQITSYTSFTRLIKPYKFSICNRSWFHKLLTDENQLNLMPHTDFYACAANRTNMLNTQKFTHQVYLFDNWWIYMEFSTWPNNNKSKFHSYYSDVCEIHSLYTYIIEFP